GHLRDRVRPGPALESGVPSGLLPFCTHAASPAGQAPGGLEKLRSPHRPGLKRATDWPPPEGTPRLQECTAALVNMPGPGPTAPPWVRAALRRPTAVPAASASPWPIPSVPGM